MIVFGTCVGYPEKFGAIAVPGVTRSMNGAKYNHLAATSNGFDIFPIYAQLMREAAHQHAEALVLMHDDLEWRDTALTAKVLRILKDESIAIIGGVGARGVKSLHWWEGDRRGWAEDKAYGVHDFGFDGGETCDVDSVDGMFLILSPWAMANLRLDGLGYEGLHGYAEELCFQARSRGKRVVVTKLDALHHTKGGVAGDSAGWLRSCEVFQRRWAR